MQYRYEAGATTIRGCVARRWPASRHLPKAPNARERRGDRDRPDSLHFSVRKSPEAASMGQSRFMGSYDRSGPVHVGTLGRQPSAFGTPDTAFRGGPEIRGGGRVAGSTPRRPLRPQPTDLGGPPPSPGLAPERPAAHTRGPPPLESVIGGARPGPNPRRTECDHASTRRYHCVGVGG